MKQFIINKKLIDFNMIPKNILRKLSKNFLLLKIITFSLCFFLHKIIYE